jgi:peptidoglycan hydrolase CwlO-like protein
LIPTVRKGIVHCRKFPGRRCTGCTPRPGKTLKGRLPVNDTHTEEGNTHMVDSSFSVIEKKISDLAGLVVALKKEKTSLAARLEQKEAEVKELTKKIAGLTSERDQIRGKVETILARIESIEL